VLIGGSITAGSRFIGFLDNRGYIEGVNRLIEFNGYSHADPTSSLRA
jgi:hypothetical protein